MRSLSHKFNAVAVERDGFRFKSKMQRKRYDELKLAQTAGDVVMFLQEVPFRMPGTVYWADFLVFWSNGTTTVEDVKGMETPRFKKIRKLWKRYGVMPLRIVKKNSQTEILEP